MNPLLITGLFDIGKDLIKKWFPNPEEAAKREAELSSLILNQELTIFKEKGSIIKEEAKSEHWLTSNWRPLLMTVFTFIVFNNYVLAPYMGALFGVSVSLDLPPEMWELLKIGVGGYIVGRSAEKGIKVWKDK